jgi:magnesium transporter
VISDKAHCLFLAADGALANDISEDRVKEIIASGKGLLWYRVMADDEVSHHNLSEIFGFHPLAIEDCFNGRVDTPKIDDYGHYLFMVTQSVQFSQDTALLNLSELDLFLGKNYVVTVEAKQKMPLVDKLYQDAMANPHVMERGADFLAHTIMDVMIDQLLPAVEGMDEDLDILEQRILERPHRDQLLQVLSLKRQTLMLRRSILPQRDIVNRLSRGEFPGLIHAEALIFFRDIYDHIVRVESILDGLRDLADGALSSYLSAINNRMNEIMKAMSVVAVIFLPLTLIASIFGTNFNYSPFGLTFGGGFYLMLLSMVIVTIGMVIFFRKRGWF